MVNGFIPQMYTAFAACLGGMSLGAILGFSSPAGPILLEGRNGLKLTEFQNVWASSIVTVGGIIGCPLGGMLMKTFGRRCTLIWIIAPYLIGWIFIGAAQTFSMILVGRLINGVCLGITCVITTMFIGEFSTPDIRGALSSMFQLMVTIGELYVFSLGIPLDNFRWIALSCALICIVQWTALLFTKESPMYLLIKSQPELAKESLQFYRGKHCDVTKELEVIRSTIEAKKQIVFEMKEFLKPQFRKPLIIAMSLQFFQQASGVNAVIFNLYAIFQDAQISLSANECSVIIGVVLVVMTLISTVMVEKAGRKVLLMLSSSMMCVSLVPLGVYFYLKSLIADDVEALQQLSCSLGWLPLASMIFYIAAFSIGFGTIPWVVMAEVFVPEAREKASTLATITNWITCFIMTSSFVPMQNSVIGSHGAYWGFAVICGCNFLFCAIVVPETRGKSIEEITQSFIKRKCSNSCA